MSRVTWIKYNGLGEKMAVPAGTVTTFIYIRTVSFVVFTSHGIYRPVCQNYQEICKQWGRRMPAYQIFLMY
jgi:hypothetical protein